jgi:esterase/lipase superfamily enzyme
MLLAVAVALCSAGCAGPSHDLLNKTAIDAPASAISATHTIFIATTRQKAKDPRQVFDGDRSLTTNYASAIVSVPKTHQSGKIERARGQGESDPARDFTARSVSLYRDKDVFRSAVSADIAKRGDRVLVFIHGFNNGFDDGVYRATQIVHDTDYPGSAVLFSWASAGKATGYLYDRDSALAARDDLEQTLRMLAGTQAKRIDIIAHSMGTWVTLEALKQLAVTGDGDLGGKLGSVVLASPDIDVDVFKKDMIRYGKPKKPFAVLLSSDDRALKLSKFISGSKARVGDYGDAADLAQYGVVVVDLSGEKAGDSLNHTKFADNPFLVQLLGKSLTAPDSLRAEEVPVDQPIADLGRGIGQTVGSVAGIVITTPLKVLTIATGGNN